jgi:hypothetical protein
MPLGDDIQALKDGAQAELTAAHDYYEDTKAAWRIVEDYVRRGKNLTIRNLITGTVTTEADIGAKARGYVTRQLAEATFQQFVSTFENVFFDLLRLWLTAYPHSLREKSLKFGAVLDTPDVCAITLDVINKELNELSYKRVRDWFSHLESLVKLECPTVDEIDQLAEAKASRDVLVHNRGRANKIYLAKSGSLARCKDGQILDIPENYHRRTWELIRRVLVTVLEAAVAKAK